MSATARLALFGAALALVAAAAAGLGFAVGPETKEEGDSTRAHTSDAGTAAHAETAASGDAAGGLAVARGGYRLVIPDATLARGEPEHVRFTIVGDDGKAVRDFDEEGGVRMHLVVVRRDLVGYQHLHPKLAADGSWRTDLTLTDAGVYRAFADFEVHGERTVLADDLFVGGDFEPARLPEAARRDQVDGYAVSLDGGAHATHEADLVFRVTRGGEPVALEPYLGARGHLVALRAGDLAYLHVHPREGGRTGEARFAATFPSDGRYRLFLQFKHEGAVRTAAFTLDVPR